MSTLSVTTLDVDTIDSKSGTSLAFTSDVKMPTQFSHRNKIINGDCRVAQRGNITLVNNTWTYGGADRIPVSASGFTTLTSGIITSSTLNGSTSGKAQFISDLTTTGAGQVAFGQKIEAINCFNLNSKTINISGKLYQDTGVGQAAVVRIFRTATIDNWGTPVQIGSDISLGSVVSATLTPFSVSLTLGSTDASNGLWVTVYFTSVGAVTTKLFGLADFQVEEGTLATPFETRPYGYELALCQRYYETSPGPWQTFTSTTPATVPYKVTKRANPTVVVTVLSGGGTNSTTSSGVDNFIGTPSGASAVQNISFTSTAEL